MRKYKTYLEAENELIRDIIERPHFITNSTFEILGTGFILEQPWNNRNTHSNYTYAHKFYEWMMSGEKDLSSELLEINPWVKRFVENKGLPESFSSSYGWKIKDQLDVVLAKIVDEKDSRKGYVNILFPADKVIFEVKSTHEFPCTIGFQLLIRDEKLYMIVNMRSNNVASVMPYDVYNFTSLQLYVADILKMQVGTYIHQINSAHLYKGDVRRLKEIIYVK